MHIIPPQSAQGIPDQHHAAKHDHVFHGTVPATMRPFDIRDVTIAGLTAEDKNCQNFMIMILNIKYVLQD
jgi:hypothetical protein